MEPIFTMEPIRVFAENSKEYARLKDAANRIKESSGLDTKVETVYYDYGQRWKWTTVIGYPDEDGNGVQILSPKKQRDILYGTEDDFHDVVAEAVGCIIDLHRSWMANRRNAIP